MTFGTRAVMSVVFLSQAVLREAEVAVDRYRIQVRAEGKQVCHILVNPSTLNRPKRGKAVVFLIGPTHTLWYSCPI